MKAVLIEFKQGLSPRLFGCYGNPNVDTPFCDQLAAQSVVFDHCYATQIQSHTRENTLEQAWRTETQQLLQQENASLHLMVTSVEPENWQQCIEQIQQIGFDQADPNVLLVIEVACDEPESKIAQWDSIVGKVYEWIRASVAEPLLILRGGCQNQRFAGESEFRESTETLLHEEQIHMPLIVQLPGIEQGQRMLALTAAGDIYPTLLDWFGIEQSELFQQAGLRSLLPVLRAEEQPRERICIHSLEGDSQGIRNAEFYLIRRENAQDPTEPLIELYLKPEDRFEIHNVAAQYPDVVTELQERWP